LPNRPAPIAPTSGASGTTRSWERDRFADMFFVLSRDLSP
jgi:hypothetical protein